MSSSSSRPHNPPATVTIASANTWKDGINHYKAITPDNVPCSYGFEIPKISDLDMYE